MLERFVWNETYSTKQGRNHDIQYLTSDLQSYAVSFSEIAPCWHQ